MQTAGCHSVRVTCLLHHDNTRICRGFWLCRLSFHLIDTLSLQWRWFCRMLDWKKEVLLWLSEFDLRFVLDSSLCSTAQEACWMIFYHLHRYLNSWAHKALKHWRYSKLYGSHKCRNTRPTYTQWETMTALTGCLWTWVHFLSLHNKVGVRVWFFFFSFTLNPEKKLFLKVLFMNESVTGYKAAADGRTPLSQVKRPRFSVQKVMDQTLRGLSEQWKEEVSEEKSTLSF